MQLEGEDSQNRVWWRLSKHTTSAVAGDDVVPKTM